ncbi:hypothetical protein [Galbibacter sp. BG1]
MGKTIGFHGKIDGWVSFYSFQPEMMVRMNGDLFSFKNGELYIHHSDNVPRNNFYGVQYTSWVEIVLNIEPSIDWVYKNIYLESNAPWEVKMTTDYTEGTISKEEFEQKESRFFAHTRQNESVESQSSTSVYGIGRIKDIDAGKFYFSIASKLVNIGDKLVVNNGTDEGLTVGTITGMGDGFFEVSQVINTPSIGDFCFSTKNQRIESESIRGPFMVVRLETDSTEFRELFAVSSNVVKSYVTV